MPEGCCVTLKHKAAVGLWLLPGVAKMQGIHPQFPLSSCIPPPGIRNLKFISPHVLKCLCPSISSCSSPLPPLGKRYPGHPWVQEWEGKDKIYLAPFTVSQPWEEETLLCHSLFRTLSPAMRKRTIKPKHSHGGIAVLPTLVVLL